MVTYSHSIVLGGLELMSRQTRLAPLTSLMIRLEMVRSKIIGQAHPVRGHGIDAFYGPDRDHVLVGPLVAHHTDRLDRNEDAEGLPDLVVPARTHHLLMKDGIGFPQDPQALGRDVSDHPHPESGPGKG